MRWVGGGLRLPTQLHAYMRVCTRPWETHTRAPAYAPAYLPGRCPGHRAPSPRKLSCPGQQSGPRPGPTEKTGSPRPRPAPQLRRGGQGTAPAGLRRH